MNQTIEIRRVNWKEIILFVALTFGMTWLLDLALALNGGLSNPAVSLALQFQMLIPAASAILLGLFVFKSSPLNNNKSISRWFVYYYLLIFSLYLVGTVYSMFNPIHLALISQILLGLSLLGMIFWIVLRIIGKYEPFNAIRMSGGRPWLWVLFGLGMVLFYGLQTALNWVFKLGTVVNLQQLIPQLATQTLPNQIVLLSIGINTILIGPFLGILIAFGEEYGWRGFLQNALEPLGRVKATLLIGLIWGIWHGPIIWMGYNYPGQPVLGTILMTLYTIVLAFVLAYSVYKGKGIWIAAFLHALNNQVMSFCLGFVYKPTENLWSFGIGIFGIVSLAIIVYFILKDPIWKES